MNITQILLCILTIYLQVKNREYYIHEYNNDKKDNKFMNNVDYVDYEYNAQEQDILYYLNNPKYYYEDTINDMNYINYTETNTEINTETKTKKEIKRKNYSENEIYFKKKKFYKNKCLTLSVERVPDIEYLEDYDPIMF